MDPGLRASRWQSLSSPDSGDVPDSSLRSSLKTGENTDELVLFLKQVDMFYYTFLNNLCHSTLGV